MNHLPGIVFQPQTHRKLQQGIHQMVTPIRATLGPLARNVVYEDNFQTRTPEIIESGGLVARRIVELEDRDADMGAMLVRHLVWRLHQTVGDCTATAAVIFQAVYDEGLRFLEAGANAVLIRQHLDKLLDTVLAEMNTLGIPVEGERQLAAIAESVCHDAPLAKLLGEIFDTIGEYGQLDVRTDAGRELYREYVEGAYWEGGVLSRELLSGGRVNLVNPAILITDLEIEEPEQLQSAVVAAAASGAKALVIMALKFSDAVTGFLTANRDKFLVVGVKSPGGILNRDAMLQDVQAMVGGRIFLRATGDRIQRLRVEHLGRARRAWADREYVGLIGGGGDPHQFRRHVAQLRASFARQDDPDARKQLQERIGKLLGGSATLRVGGLGETEAKTRKKTAERVAEVVRGAVHSGVIPGGGAALLACQPLIEARLKAAQSYEERAACRMMFAALEAPTRAIAANAGYDPGSAVAGSLAAGRGWGFDACAGQVVEMSTAGIFDVASAYQSALRGAVSSAAQALSIDVLIHRRSPEQVLDPG